MAYMQTLC